MRCKTPQCTGKYISLCYAKGETVSVRYRCADCSALLFSDSLTIGHKPHWFDDMNKPLAAFTREH